MQDPCYSRKYYVGIAFNVVSFNTLQKTRVSGKVNFCFSTS